MDAATRDRRAPEDRTAAALVAVALVAMCLGACGDDGGDREVDGDGSADAGLADTGPVDLGPRRDAEPHEHDAGPPLAPVVDAHTCIEDPERVTLAWESLRNPILQLPDHALKDVSIRHQQGQWWLFGSRIAEDPFRFRIGVFTSEDLGAWMLEDEWDDPAVGGLASPDLTRHEEGYVAVYNSHTTDAGGALPKLYRRVASTPEELSRAPAERLAADILPQPFERLIDAALAHTDDGLLLAFKRFQTFTLALAPSGRLEGPWELLGEAALEDAVENYQFLRLDDAWHLLATTIPSHRPRLYVRGERWTDWEPVATFDVPAEDWNTVERANAAFLCDARAVDGHWYLFYSGSTELDRFDGRGWAALGVARSPDLTTWTVPGG